LIFLLRAAVPLNFSLVQNLTAAIPSGSPSGVIGPEGSPVPLADSIITPEEFEAIARRIAAET
jgi:hypothetical protein